MYVYITCVIQLFTFGCSIPFCNLKFKMNYKWCCIAFLMRAITCIQYEMMRNIVTIDLSDPE